MMWNTPANDYPEVKVTYEINATAEDIFNAWIDPSMICRWMFGQHVRNEKLIKIETDPRKGGRFSFIVEREGQLINHTGTYLEISPYNRLVFTWGIESVSEGESIVQVDIVPLQKGCLLHLTHRLDSKWEAYRNLTAKGWSYMLDKLNGIFNRDQ